MCKVLNAGFDLSGAFRILAIIIRLILRTEYRRSAFGARRGHTERPGTRLSSPFDNSADLWDDIAPFFHNDRITNPYVEFCDLVLVVQRRTGYSRPTHKYGFQIGDRGYRSHTPHLKEYVVKDSFLFS